MDDVKYHQSKGTLFLHGVPSIKKETDNSVFFTIDNSILLRANREMAEKVKTAAAAQSEMDITAAIGGYRGEWKDKDQNERKGFIFSGFAYTDKNRFKLSHGQVSVMGKPVYISKERGEKSHLFTGTLLVSCGENHDYTDAQGQAHRAPGKVFITFGIPDDSLEEFKSALANKDNAYVAVDGTCPLYRQEDTPGEPAEEGKQSSRDQTPSAYVSNVTRMLTGTREQVKNSVEKESEDVVSQAPRP